jgi:hypothetical protein
MLVVADHARAEAVAEEMAVPAVALVEGLCVAPVQALHAVREALEPSLDQQMEVIVEQDPGNAVPAVAADRAAREVRPEVTVVVVADDLLPGDAAGGDVVDAACGEQTTSLAGHEPKLAAPHGGARLPAAIVALLLQSRDEGHGPNGHGRGLSPAGAAPHPSGSGRSGRGVSGDCPR